MLPSKAKTVFNVSHLAGNSYFLSSDVAKIRDEGGRRRAWLTFYCMLLEFFFLFIIIIT